MSLQKQSSSQRGMQPTRLKQLLIINDKVRDISAENDKQEVTVVDIKIPFVSMVVFMWISQDVIRPITLAHFCPKPSQSHQSQDFYLFLFDSIYLMPSTD